MHSSSTSYRRKANIKQRGISASQGWDVLRRPRHSIKLTGSFVAPSSDPNDPSGGGSLHDKLSHINPRVYDLQIVSSTPSSLTLEAKMNFTNPTNYTATVPHFNILIVKNGSVIGDATVSNLEVREGNNTGSLARVTWNPLSSHADKHSPEIARNLLSQYISGYNCTMQFRTHADSVPGNPGIGKALERYPIEMPMPHLSAPLPDDDSDGDDDEDGKDRPSFIKEATFHLLSSTAVFLMHSPFAHTTMYLETINATAFYNGTEVIGTIDYRFPFKVVPGVSESPRLPVKRSEEGMGWDRIREALGGRLRLNAKAEAGVRIGEWREDVWVEAGGIGSKVRL